VSRRVIYKYEIPSEDVGIVMPKGGEVLHVGEQGGRPHAWVLVDPQDAPLVSRKLTIVGTSQLVPDAPYVGTFFNGQFVWHVFDEGEVKR